MGSNGHNLRLVVNRDKQDSPIRGVYLVTDHGDRLAERVEAAIDGGVRIIQYRNKGKDRAQRYAVGEELRDLCSRRGVIFIVNDDLDLALQLKSDGIHLGQEDGDPRIARRELGPGKIIGVSTHTMEEALAAQAAGADYIGFGAMFPTNSKEIEHLAGPEGLAAIRNRIMIPIVAIGGITRDNGPRVVDAGADALAVISAVLAHPDPFLAATELGLLFNRRALHPRGAVLTIAGSDSGGGAGIQADLKTATLLGSYGSSVITALTAQNTRGVSGIHGVPPSFVADQLDAVLSDIPVDTVKTGMLFSAEIIATVADKLTEYRKRIVVVDPVMVAKGGAPLIDRGAVNVLKDRLMPRTYLLTPNIPEAERLTGLTIVDEEGMQEAARRLFRLGARNVLVKGGHLVAGDAVDILFDGSAFHRFTAPRILSKNTHGTGCTYAAAIATYLAQGEPLREAVGRAKEFVTAAIRLGQPLGRGHGPVNHLLAALEVGDRGPGTGDR
ncbi:bifunctional hydroxymethylpyrimidine kinase/phosphomethylpyrimidine kinase [Geobacter grbiciae]|uniref:bifunctional hydroxymethylpyrimidine kinase/phosphomethylpyrimidine kinase n=1 Tax=Geobacter grbiciae TaxID=155042 RepID=UPI001C02CFBC|nr:bifunctional hydroxymethylpyrimidine kinase/phosphomethylpyrimidine kinase [Geobacter grbiciae]MBT1075016.1 bifunctional hydroxymethylpyrimidine kinase/phosphomethylpyrimidine kinase [Geobacter grbiciae]